MNQSNTVQFIIIFSNLFINKPKFNLQEKISVSSFLNSILLLFFQPYIPIQTTNKELVRTRVSPPTNNINEPALDNHTLCSYPSFAFVHPYTNLSSYLSLKYQQFYRRNQQNSSSKLCSHILNYIRNITNSKISKLQMIRTHMQPSYSTNQNYGPQDRHKTQHMIFKYPLLILILYG